MTAQPEPFKVLLNDGILQLTLDTPACSHNILSRDAAAQLCRILDATGPHRVAVIVIRSGKPNSWINGVGLLMAGTAQCADDIPVMTREVTRAYRALRNFPAPSVAVIEGNCYGCGIEFALHCDFRVACESYETHFYMTELAEYLFIPAFGGTQDLPHLLGLEAATDLLLWGERWSARQAAERGLVDQSFEAGEFNERVSRFVRVLAAEPRKRPITRKERYGPKQEAHMRATLDRIEMLPPAYQLVYREAYALMTGAAKATALSPDHYSAELGACGESVVRPIAKASVGLFFVRQLATHYCLRGYQLPETIQTAIDPADRSLSGLRRELIERMVRGVRVVPDEAEASRGIQPLAPADLLLEFATPPEGSKTLRPGVIGATLRPHVRARTQTGCTVYSPLSSGSRLVEIAADTSCSLASRQVFALLDRAGFCPVLSHPDPSGEFASNLLLAHHLAPLIGFVMDSGRAVDVHASLREFGFVRSIEWLLRAVPDDLLCQWITPLVPHVDQGAIRVAIAELASSTYRGGVMRPDLLDALLISLCVFAMDALRARVIPHPALLDVMARELIDYPLMHGSLCRYFSEKEIARLAARASSSAPYFSAAFLRHAIQALAAGYKFYHTSPRTTPVSRYEAAHAS